MDSKNSLKSMSNYKNDPFTAKPVVVNINYLCSGIAFTCDQNGSCVSSS